MRRQLLHALPPRRTSPPDGRHRHEPHRLPVRPARRRPCPHSSLSRAGCAVTPSPQTLPSWRPGATRDTVLGFLEAAESLPAERRVAAFDNDGTLWCEKPTYVQFDFFEDALRSA